MIKPVPQLSNENSIRNLPQEDRSYIQKGKDELSRILQLGDASENWRGELSNALHQNPISKIDVFRVIVSAGYSLVPEDKRREYVEKGMRLLPIDIPHNNGYKVLERLGSGYENSVFYFESEEKDFAVGILRTSFKTEADALKYATYMKKEYLEYKKLFKNVPDLIPSEEYILAEVPPGKISVVSFREFVPGELWDAFEVNLPNIFANNANFRHQFEAFTEVISAHKEELISKGFDILGYRNLAVAGKEGSERLVLLEPHSVAHTIDNDKKKSIRKRLNFLINISQT